MVRMHSELKKFKWKHYYLEEQFHRIIDTVVLKQERHKINTKTSFVKIWPVNYCEFNANFLTFLGLYHLLFALETIGVS